jgi:uncharacterized membrane protein YgdD (TMEM256/DUF423 family)
MDATRLVEDLMVDDKRPFLFAALGGLCAAASVGAGAFGAHALKAILDVSSQAVYETAARYQMYHALALFVVAWLLRETESALVSRAGWLFCLGIVLFCGSLYLVALSGIKWMGAVTPLGGLAFIGGWLILGWSAWTARAAQ